MITSSEFFKKTFFDLEPNFPTNDNSHKQKKYIEPSSSSRNQKNFSSLSNTKSQLKEHYNQFQLQRSQKKCNYNKEMDQLTIDVTPWGNHPSSLTSRELYDTKQNLNREREKIKSTISKYKFTRTIEEIDREHANFIKSPKKNNKKINFILYQYEENKSNKKGNVKKVNLIKSIDINKTYEQYLNHEMEIDEDFLFKSRINVKTHNKKIPLGSNKKTPSRQGRGISLIENSSSKQLIKEAIKKNLVCCQYLEDYKHQKTENIGTQISKKSELQQENICHGTKLSERKRIVDKAKSLKFEMNRKIFKGSKTSMNGVGPLVSMNLSTGRQKLSFEVAGNKTHKLRYPE